MASPDSNDINRKQLPSANAAVDDSAQIERSALAAERREYITALKRSPAISTAMFVAASVILLIVHNTCKSEPAVSALVAILQAFTLLRLVYRGVYSISNLHRRNYWVDAMVALGYIVAAVVLCLACSYCIFGLASSDHVRVSDYPSSLYFSVVTITTLGYGDLHPVGISRVFAALEALIGYVLLGTFVGLLVSRMMPSRGDGADC